MILAEIEARLGRKEEAMRGAERAAELLPVAEDAFDGLRMLSRLAGVYARVGETDRALDLLKTVVAKPSGPHYGELMLDERWDPVRAHPRFLTIAASVEPKQSARP
jgi:hypothetical protein